MADSAANPGRRRGGTAGGGESKFTRVPQTPGVAHGLNTHDSSLWSKPGYEAVAIRSRPAGPGPRPGA
jgi:hypothetical protein